MVIVEAKAVEIAEQHPLKKIELCGRVCYKSEDKITEDSHMDFVRKMVERKHYAMLEHVPLVLMITARMAHGLINLGHGTYINVTCNGKEERYMASGNARAWLMLFQSTQYRKKAQSVIESCESFLQMSLGKEVYKVLFPNVYKINVNRNFLMTQEEILQLPNLTEEEAHAHLYLTGLFTCDRGVSHELVRHRPASFAQESTRYCNYGISKFGKEITCVHPGLTDSAYDCWLGAVKTAEAAYFDLLEKGCTPQLARGVLPTDLKTEVVMTCNLGEWQHVINLRYHGTTGAPHPHMQEVMGIWYEYVKIKEGYNKWIQ